LLGLLILLVLLELALQAAGPLVQRAMARRDGPPDPDAPLTLLCVGDSNTFGLHMPRVYAYPSQLELRLARRYAQPASVINRGVPGQNGAQVARALGADLAHTNADVVLVLVGINDTWNRTAESSGPSALLARSRLVRLARVFTAGITTAGEFKITSNDQGEIEVDRGDGPVQVNEPRAAGSVLTGDALSQRVRVNLERVVAICLDHGAKPVLMTYAEFQGDYAVVNAAIRNHAEEQDLLLIDHEQVFEPIFQRDGYETLMLNDQHPNLRGYQVMASTIEAALADAGLVPPILAAASGSEPIREPDSQPVVTARPGGRLELTGPAGWSWQLLIGRPADADSGLGSGDLAIPLRDDAVLALSRLEPAYSGRFETGKSLTVTVSHRLLGEAGTDELTACLLLLRSVLSEDAADTSPIAAISAAVPVQR
jgi:lysophospholipase L1-like esterase